MPAHAESPAISRDAVERLDLLERLAEAADARAIADEARELRERVTAGRFFVACVGQFKRGKSTLLNALVGRDILPTGVVPVTAVLTIVRHGPHLRARVRFADGHEADVDPATIAEYVTEARNPANGKHVAAVEVDVPSEILASGMCLVDTPGLGSVFAANSATTTAFVPHIDAALVVLGSDPPISGEELALVERIGTQVGEMLLALNKSDRVSDADSEEAGAFTADTLARRLDRPVGRVYRVSAVERRAGHVTRDWGALEAALRALAGRSDAVLQAAVGRGTGRIRRELLREVAEQRTALVRPIEQSERRLGALRAAIGDAELALRELSARMQVEHVALTRRFGEARQAFIQRAVWDAHQELADAIRALPAHRGPATRTAAMRVARDIAERRVLAWAEEIAPQAEAMYAATTTRFVEMANDFIRRVAPDGQSITVDEIAGEQGFREPERFYFTSLLALTDTGFWTWLFDWMRPAGSRIASSIRRASQYLERLLASNSARVANDLSSRVAESQRRLESEIRQRLSTLLESAERALTRARAQRAAGAEAVNTELTRLDELRDRVERLSPSEPPARHDVDDGQVLEGRA